MKGLKEKVDVPLSNSGPTFSEQIRSFHEEVKRWRTTDPKDINLHNLDRFLYTASLEHTTRGLRRGPSSAYSAMYADLQELMAFRETLGLRSPC